VIDMKARRSGQDGYTLVELIVVLAVVGALSGLAIYAGAGAVRSAQTARHVSGVIGHTRLAQLHAIEYHVMRRLHFDPSSHDGVGYTRYRVEYYSQGESPWTCSPGSADGEERANLKGGGKSKFKTEVEVSLPAGQRVEVDGAYTHEQDPAEVGPRVYFDCTGKPALISTNVTLRFSASGSAPRVVTMQWLSGRVFEH
jgi:prepilin-type N-terminal cleavage/methylation domain-containing protein